MKGVRHALRTTGAAIVAPDAQIKIVIRVTGIVNGKQWMNAYDGKAFPPTPMLAGHLASRPIPGSKF